MQMTISSRGACGRTANSHPLKLLILVSLRFFYNCRGWLTMYPELKLNTLVPIHEHPFMFWISSTISRRRNLRPFSDTTTCPKAWLATPNSREWTMASLKLFLFLISYTTSHFYFPILFIPLFNSSSEIQNILEVFCDFFLSASRRFHLLLMSCFWVFEFIPIDSLSALNFLLWCVYCLQVVIRRTRTHFRKWQKPSGVLLTNV